jgi:epsilon-lactone hydrolase
VTEPTPRERVRDLFLTMPAEPPSMDALRAAYDGVVAHGPVPSDAQVTEVDAGGVRALLVRARGASSSRTIVWFHSGGYMVGSVDAYRAFGIRLSEAADAEVLLVDYRLAPEHPFPAAIDDAVAAARWAIETRPAGSVVVGGDSAGGGLSLAVHAELRDAGVRPAAGIALSPLADLALTGESIATNEATDFAGNRAGFIGIAETYHPGGDRTDPRSSPFHADLNGLAPFYLAAGSLECLLDDSTRIAERMHAGGDDVTLEIGEDLGHIWPIFFAILPEGEETVVRLGQFVRQHTSA